MALPQAPRATSVSQRDLPVASIVEKTFALLGDAWSTVRGTAIGFVNGGGEWAPASGANPLPVTLTGLTGTALAKSSVTMTGASATLLAADPTRKVVIVSSTKANSSAAIDISGGTAALDAGIPLEGGDTVQITGKEAQSAMTQIGTNGQKLTVYVGS